MNQAKTRQSPRATVFKSVGFNITSIPVKYRKIVHALIITNLISVAFFGLRIIGADSTRYWFMLWNLALAWVAPIIAWYLYVRLQKTSWWGWWNIALTVLWLGFLPNSFYVVTDLIHLDTTGEINIIYDAVLLTSFAFNGFIAGFIGTYLIHKQILHRQSQRLSMVLIGGIFLLSSYAIYLGRVLRWNTWDALLHPAGLLFDISDNLINPLNHLQSFVVTFSFLILIGGFYWLFWETMRLHEKQRR